MYISYFLHGDILLPILSLPFNMFRMNIPAKHVQVIPQTQMVEVRIPKCQGNVPLEVSKCYISKWVISPT